MVIEVVGGHSSGPRLVLIGCNDFDEIIKICEGIFKQASQSLAGSGPAFQAFSFTTYFHNYFNSTNQCFEYLLFTHLLVLIKVRFIRFQISWHQSSEKVLNSCTCTQAAR